MKILILNGSPKKENSDTLHITRAFVAGMEQMAKHDVKLVHAVEKNVQYCKGCFTCMRGGGTCVEMWS